MDLIVGIDFTGSNGNPDFPTSLHYVDASEKKLNQYEQAILAVGSILEPYDTDHFHHVFGYGAKLPLTGEASGSYSKVQHCFPLLDQDNHPVYGIDGILRVSTSHQKFVLQKKELFFIYFLLFATDI